MNFEELNAKFREYGRTLGSVESFTGGLFAMNVTKIPGASHFYKGGFVTYQTEEKVRILGIPYLYLDQYGVVSQETASMMATQAQRLLATDYCVSFTGNAGPQAMENKPVGEIYIGVSYYRNCKVFKFNLSGTREEIQNQAINLACEIVLAILEEIK